MTHHTSPTPPDPATSHDDQAEQALLGAMLVSPQAVATAIAQLQPTDLYRPHHILIWHAIVDTDAWGDPVLTLAELTRTGHITKIPGAGAYLTDCVRNCPLPGPDHISHYSRIIREHAATRRRAQTALQLTYSATDPDTYAHLIQAAQHDVGHPNGANGARPVRLTYAADTQPRASMWLWQRRIPYAAITLIGGPGAVGKSTLSYDLLAKVTRGQLDGELAGEARSVAIVAAEEAWAEMAVPRLIAAGADLRRAVRIEPLEEGHARGLTLPVDVDLLTGLCPELDIAVVFIDPIIGTIRGRLDTHKDSDVRQALEPLAHMCETTHTTVIATIHLNKANNTDPLKAFMGSSGFVNVSRSALLAVPDPQADADGRYLLAHAKSNNGPRQATLTYRLIEVIIEPLDPYSSREIGTNRVVWDGDDPAGRSAEDILATPREQSAVGGKLAQDILAWFAEHHPDELVASREITRAFPTVARNTVDQQLRRLASRGQLDHSTRGYYSLIAGA